MGLIATKFSIISIEHIRMILESYITGVNPIDIITIVSFMEAQSYIDTRSKQKYQAKFDSANSRNKDYYLMFHNELI